VLGGGGVLGIAWETGVLAGLREAGVDLHPLRDVIGTSAGSLVGAALASGVDPRERARREAGAAAAESERTRSGEGGGRGEGSAAPDSDQVNRIFRTWGRVREPDRDARRELGALALAARTVSPERFVRWVERQLESPDWPPALRVTAVDAESGELRVLAADSGVPLARAVAASCAVPGIYPPIELLGRRCMDGGVRSGTSADLAAERDPDAVLVVAPITGHMPGLGRLSQRLLDREVAELRAQGIAVHVVGVDADDARTLGMDLLSPKRRAPALEAGLARGRREAEAVAELFALS